MFVCLGYNYSSVIYCKLVHPCVMCRGSVMVTTSDFQSALVCSSPSWNCRWGLTVALGLPETSSIRGNYIDLSEVLAILHTMLSSFEDSSLQLDTIWSWFPEMENVLYYFGRKLLFCFVESYGIKTVDDVNRLTGPGLKTKDQPGMVSGGGKWPGRWFINDF